MSKFLLKIKPLGPYLLGTDNNFARDGEEGSYIVDSLKVPNITSVIGMLRFAILEANNVLNSDFNYSSADREKMNELIGKNSFSFIRDNELGIIKEISPLFILKNDDLLIKAPLCLAANENKTIEITPKARLITDFSFDQVENTTFIPDGETFNNDVMKNYSNDLYYNLTTDELVKESDIFKSDYYTGNKKGSDKQGFFKQEMISMNKDYCFAVVVDINDSEYIFPDMTIGYMGKRRASFLLERSDMKIDLEKTVTDKLKSKLKNNWYYALSDIRFKGDCNYRKFNIVSEKSVRNMEVIYDENKKYSISKNVKYNLISSGSVFYEDEPFKLDEKLKKFGYNYLLKIEGENNAI